jgi:uncharacterized protein
MPKRIGTWYFPCFDLANLGGRAGKPVFACEKVVFLLSLLYVDNKGMHLFPFRRLKCQNWQMASRQFLKIMRSARLGDVSAQQSLASAYLTGAFNTPIQPANALIWLEKAYFSITNQSISKLSPDSD